MALTSSDLKKIRDVVEETVSSESYLKKIEGVVEETVSSESYLKKIEGVVEETVSSELYLKKIEGVVRSSITEALEEVVFPKFDELEEEMATKEDLSAVEERLGRRIDKLAEVATDVKTNHERRIRRLEKETGVESMPIMV